MKSLTVFNSIFQRSKLFNLVSAAIYSTFFALFLLVISHKESQNTPILFVTLALTLQLLYHSSWSRFFSETIRSPFNFLKPGFIRSAYWSQSLYLFITVFIPIIIGFFLLNIDSGYFLFVAMIGISSFALMNFNQITGAIWTSVIILWSAGEEAKFFNSVEESKTTETLINHHFSYLPVDSHWLALVVIAFSIYLLYFFTKLTPKKTIDSSCSNNDEIQLRYKARGKISSFIDQAWLQFKYRFFQSIGVFNSRIEVVLMSGQYQSIFLFRLFVFVLAIFSINNHLITGFFIGLGDGFNAGFSDSSNSNYEFNNSEIITLSIFCLALLGIFDNSIFSRFLFAQRFLWLREPVDGITSFKALFTGSLVRKMMFEIGFSLTTFILILIEFKLEFTILLFLLLGYLCLKSYSIIVGYLTLLSNHRKVSYFCSVAAYAIFFVFWVLISTVVTVADLVVLAVLSVLFLSIIVYGFNRIKHSKTFTY